MKKFTTIAIILCVILFVVFTASCATTDNSFYLVLVNKTHKLPDNWLKNIAFAEGKNSVDKDDIFLVEKETYEHFIALRDELLVEEGIDIELDSTYRSVEQQEELWDYFREQYGEDYCQQYLAVPGYSEHHTGLAIDVFIIKDGEVIRENDAMIAERETFAKIHEKLAMHGFILRYPEGKEDITGYAYEPWHFRYVGELVALDIMEKGITLEEFLGQTS